MGALREAQMGIGKGARNFNWVRTGDVVTGGEVQTWQDYATTKTKKQKFLSREDVEEVVTFIAVVNGALFGSSIRNAFDPLITRIRDSSDVKFSLFFGRYTLSMVNDALADAHKQTLKFIKTKEAQETSTQKFLADAIENGLEQFVQHSNEGQMMYVQLQKHIRANAAVFNMGADIDETTAKNNKRGKKRGHGDSSEEDEVSDEEPEREALRRSKAKAKKERKKAAKALLAKGTGNAATTPPPTTAPKNGTHGKNKDQTSMGRGGAASSGHDCFNHALYLLGERNIDCKFGSKCTSHHASAKDPYKASAINADAKKFRSNDAAGIVKIKSALEKKIADKDPLFTT